MPKTIVVASTAGIAELTPSTALAPDSVLRWSPPRWPTCSW